MKPIKKIKLSSEYGELKDIDENYITNQFNKMVERINKPFYDKKKFKKIKNKKYKFIISAREYGRYYNLNKKEIPHKPSEEELKDIFRKVENND